MRKVFALFISAAAMLQANAQIPAKTLTLVPAPASITIQSGHFILKNPTTISASDQEAAKIAQQLATALSRPTGFKITVGKQGGAIKLNLLSTADPSLGTEGYTLTSSPAGVQINANQPAGLFYGMQSLIQLFPKEIESKTQIAGKWQIPAITIKDQPRFGWRGLMFDVSRHFFGKEAVKQFIDEMVKYKFNLLHLHLTDDQGWRIQIKSLPKLTEVGAWRPLREGKWANTPEPSPNEPKTYGGFYTHEDIRELVQYAKERFVNILPEIDIPGHSMAMLAAYPDLSATPGSTYTVNAGEKFMEWPPNAHFYALKDNNLSPANEKVYQYLDQIFTEVAQLFPFEYIHMGGDETAKNLWEKSEEIKQLMQREKLQSMDEVQSYFVKRVEKIIQSKGKKMMGWDEILEGGLAPSAAVMSWRGMKGGIAAAKMNHQVVMSPTDFAYLDYYQGERTMEPPIYAGLRLNKTYQFDPVPAEVDPKYILGGQGNLWTEQLQNYRAIQYMLFPRALALAESVWTPKERKNWNGFVNRVEGHFMRMDVAGTRYSKGMYDPIISATNDANGNLAVVMEKEFDDLDIYFSIDESNPDQYYRKYTEPYTLPKDVATVKVVTYRDGKQVGRQINLSVEELKRRVPRK